MSALTGGLGGLMEGMDAQRVMQGNRNANATTMEFLRQQQQGQGGAAPTAASGQGAPSGQGGVGSDHVASTSNTDFINSIMPQAQRIAAQTGLSPRLVAAQAALESNYGKSAPGGNLFGIKGSGTGPLSTMESVNGQMVPTKASFASYDSPTASFDGYGKLMSGSRFAGVRGAQGLNAQIDALGKSGYATDPNYAAKVGAIARGLQVPSASLAAGQSASADMPAPNATPVASNTLPPGVTSEMLGPDASIRDHLMAAADQGARHPGAASALASGTALNRVGLNAPEAEATQAALCCVTSDGSAAPARSP